MYLSNSYPQTIFRAHATHESQPQFFMLSQVVIPPREQGDRDFYIHSTVTVGKNLFITFRIQVCKHRKDATSMLLCESLACCTVE